MLTREKAPEEQTNPFAEACTSGPSPTGTKNHRAVIETHLGKGRQLPAIGISRVRKTDRGCHPQHPLLSPERGEVQQS